MPQNVKFKRSRERERWKRRIKYSQRKKFLHRDSNPVGSPSIALVAPAT